MFLIEYRSLQTRGGFHGSIFMTSTVLYNLRYISPDSPSLSDVCKKAAPFARGGFF